MIYIFTLVVNVYDPEQLQAAAKRHPDADQEARFLDDEGNIEAAECLAMLLDPGSLPGCNIQTHFVEAHDA